MSKQQSKKKVQEDEIEVTATETAVEPSDPKGYEEYVGRFWRGNTFIHSLGRTVSGKVTEETLKAFINAVPDSVDLDNWISETDVHAEQNNREKVLTNVN